MEEEEARLRFALVAQVGNTSREFSAADVSRAVAEVTGLAAANFHVTPSFPESFLIVCSSQEARDTAFGASPVPLATTFLSLRQWTRLVRAHARTLYHKVGIEMDEIPEHAWDRDTASKLLSKHAWIEHLDIAAANKTDLTTFKLTAWTKDPSAIPTSRTLSIAEPELRVTYCTDDMQRIFGNLEPYLRRKVVLEYPITIHLRSIADFSPRTPSSSEPSPSDDGDSGHDGNPDRSYGFRKGVGPRLSGFPRREAQGGGGHGGAAAGAGHEGDGGRRNRRVAPSEPKADELTWQAAPQRIFPKVASNTSPATTAATALHGATTATAVQSTVAPHKAPPKGPVDARVDQVALDDSPAATVTLAALPVDWAISCAELPRDREAVTPAPDPMLIEPGIAGPPSQPKATPRQRATTLLEDPAPTRYDQTPPPRTQLSCARETTDEVAHPEASAATVATPPHGQETTVLMEFGNVGPASKLKPAPPRPTVADDPALACCTPAVPSRMTPCSPVAEDPMLIDALPALELQVEETLQVERSITALVNGTHPIPPRHSEETQSGGLQATMGCIPGDGPCDADLDPDSPPGFSRAAARQEAKLRAFTSQVQAKIRSPLAPRPAKTKRTAPVTPRDELPKRSLRLASHPMANVPSAKRAEVILMQRFGLIPEGVAVNTEGKKAYEKLYSEGGLVTKNFEAMRDLMPALKNASTFLGMQA
ncbi:unnamed protein product [Urochloa humidicola]